MAGGWPSRHETIKDGLVRRGYLPKYLPDLRLVLGTKTLPAMMEAEELATYDTLTELGTVCARCSARHLKVATWSLDRDVAAGHSAR